jgi:hypothetical protein
MRTSRTCVTAVAFAFAFVAVAHAGSGVGVNVAKIEVSDLLRPGGGYTLPPVGVINTGDQPGDYEVYVTYLHDQPERRPSQTWFEFQPQRFFLEPNQTERVAISLELPSGVTPGDYFAFIEARPVAEADGVSIGVAAATQLTFTVEPSSWLAAQRLRISRFLRDIEPWSYVVEGLILAGALAYLGRRYSPVRLRNPFEPRR